MDYVNQDVICPKCGKRIAFDDFAECYDTMADPCEGQYVEYVAYDCECGNDFTAEIVYDLKFKRVVQ